MIVIRTGVSIGATAILARLLTPADYGYVAMATVVVELAAVFCAFNIPAIIIQARRITRLDLDSGFWFSVVLAAIVAAAIVAGSPHFADAFGEPRLTPILWAMSTILLFDELSAVHQAIAFRMLLFKFEVISQLGSLIVRVACSVYLALSGFGVWSLVLGSIAGRAAQCLLIWYLIPYVPRFRFRTRFLTRNWRAGGSYFGSAATAFGMSNVDTAVMGRIFGATQLGYYQTAFALPEELRNRIVFALQRVLFPAYALVQSDSSAFRQGVLKSLGLLGAITMPMGVGMMVLASPIVRTLYGEQWLPVIPLLQIVAIVGVVRSIHTLLGNIYKAKGRPDLDFKIGLAFAPLLPISLFVGSRYGAVGVATAVLVFNVLLLASNYLALRLIDLAAIDALASVVPATASALVMGAGLLALDMAHVIPRSTPFFELILSVAIGSLLFLAAFWLISPATVRDLWAMRKFLRMPN